MKIIDLDKFVKEGTNGKFVVREHKMAIIENNGKVVMIDDEAVHYLHNKTDKFEIDLYDAPKVNPDGSRSIAIMPSNLASVALTELIDNAEEADVPLREFVRRFGSRIESNYATLLKTIKKIGLNPKDFARNLEKEKVA